MIPHLCHHDLVRIKLPAFSFPQCSFIFLHKLLRLPMRRRWVNSKWSLHVFFSSWLSQDLNSKCTSVSEFTVKSQVSSSLARVSPSVLGSVFSSRPRPPSASPAPLVTETPASPLSPHSPLLHCHLPRWPPALNWSYSRGLWLLDLSCDHDIIVQ